MSSTSYINRRYQQMFVLSPAMQKGWECGKDGNAVLKDSYQGTASAVPLSESNSKNGFSRVTSAAKAGSSSFVH
jgi:hypothetical protein